MKLKSTISSIAKTWSSLRRKRNFRSLVQYMVFVAIAALFWFILALNDNLLENVEVKVRIYDVPDSATFIDLPPSSLHVTVRDKGTSLLRTAFLRRPVMNINFKEYSDRGILRIPPSELYALLRGTFGTSAQITSVSIDSLHLGYTMNPGRQVLVGVRGVYTAADGFEIGKKLYISNRYVMIYSDNPDADTISKVYTSRFVCRNLDAPERVSVALEAIPGVRMIPAKVSVTIPVEALVKKKATVPVKVINVPAQESLLIFPANVDITYFVPMSRFNEPQSDIVVTADYQDIVAGHRSRMPISVEHHGHEAINVTLLTDSVEYTIVRQ